MTDIFETLEKYVRSKLDQDDIHGYPHVKRVIDLSINIGIQLKADIKILKTAALLHDIGRNAEKNNLNSENHAEISARIAKNYLNSLNSDFSQKEIQEIIHCIIAHSYSNKVDPLTLEAKILSDVDKLDALGAIGIYRTIVFTIKNNGGIEQVINHLEKKILKLQNKMYLEITKDIAKERSKIVFDFYKSINNEI